MEVISVNQTTNKRTGNWFSKICRLFKSNSYQSLGESMSISELTSKLLTRSQLDIILEHLPQESYETNVNQTIYSLKSNGKPFFIDYDQYDYDIYSHQTTVGNGLYFSDKHKDLMYVLRILFNEQNTSELKQKELEYILNILPQSYYEVNANQTIYSFKLNGKPFFIDKSHYNYEEYPFEMKVSSHLVNQMIPINEETDITVNSSEILGQQIAEKSRWVFIQFKSRSTSFRHEFFDNSRSDGLTESQSSCDSDNNELIYQNSENTEPIRMSSKGNKLYKNLAKRKVYQKSNLMIHLISAKTAKHILKKCKKSLFKSNGRNERRKSLAQNAKLSPVNNCDLLKPTLYAICETIEPNDINHNIKN